MKDSCQSCMTRYRKAAAEQFSPGGSLDRKMIELKRAVDSLLERCAHENHTTPRADGQCLCGVFYIGVTASAQTSST